MGGNESKSNIDKPKSNSIIFTNNLDDKTTIRKSSKFS